MFDKYLCPSLTTKNLQFFERKEKKNSFCSSPSFPPLLKKQQRNYDTFLKKITETKTWPKKQTKNKKTNDSRPQFFLLSFRFGFLIWNQKISLFFSFRSFPFCKKKMWSILIDQNIIVICLFLKRKDDLLCKKKVKRKKKNYKKIELRTLLQLLFKKLKPKSKKPTIRKKQL